MNPKDSKIPSPATRRSFLQVAGLTVAGLPGRDLFHPSTMAAAQAGSQPGPVPWYRRTLRWGQTNITEKDPERYDIAWWRRYWKQTQIQGVIINAGGIVAYYPSKFPLQHRAEFLAGRDLFGELVKAAREDGMVVLARMDSNRAGEEFYRAHPGWFAVDAAGKPYRAGELYVSCINSPYYEEYLPGVLREIIEREHPEGFTDNSWSGLGRNSICYCEYCARRFREHSGRAIPEKKNWSDPVYRQWIQWSYIRRLEVWDLNNRTTRGAGGEDCIWIGMNSGSISGQAQSFRNYREICRRAEIIMLDHQARSDAGGFQQNGETGKLIHGLLGWEKLIPESMPMYQAGRPAFRLSSKPEPEARMWMVEGLAGGIQPWWHHVGAYHEDRRMYHTAVPIFRWHKTNEEFLLHRRPMATVGVLWSQGNTDFYGQDNAEEMVDLPFRGMTQALIRARIPYIPVHADDLDREAPGLSVVLLPNLGAMSEAQVASVRHFVQRGGGLIATGDSSLCDEWGERKSDFALSDLFGAHVPRGSKEDIVESRRKRVRETRHTYLRLAPEMRARVEGPKSGSEPVVSGARHSVLQGFDETDILPFGGTLQELEADAQASVLMTFIPEFPIFPPETAWMREPKTNLPGLLLNTVGQKGRVAFMPADLDRRYGQDNLPDHGRLLANLVRWGASDDIPLAVEGRGLIDCHLYRQPGRLILHLVNLTSAGTWRQPVDELIPVGPFRVRVKMPEGVAGKTVRLLVANQKSGAVRSGNWSAFEVRSILDHEVAVLE
jgi:hypothetical protein